MKTKTITIRKDMYYLPSPKTVQTNPMQQLDTLINNKII